MRIMRALAVLVVLVGCAIPIPADREAHFEAAVRLQKQGKDKSAYRFYRRFLELYPGSEHEESVIQNAYEITLKNYTSLWGKSELESLLTMCPAAPLASEAQFRVGCYQFNTGNYEEAIIALEKLCADHPESERVEAAMFLSAESELKQYQGPEYEGAPLRKAREQLERLLSAFPEGAYARDARKRLARIGTELACRDYLIALYYRRRGRHASAATYLNSIVKEYPNTEYARRAKEMLTVEPKREK